MPLVLNLRYRHLGQFASDLFSLDAYAGQGGDTLGPVLIVEADNAHVSRNLVSIRTQRLYGAVRDVVGPGEDGRDWSFLVQNHLDTAEPIHEAVVRERNSLRPRFQSGIVHALLVRLASAAVPR